MKQILLFTLYAAIAVFGFIIINFWLLELFQLELNIPKDTSKSLLVFGWGAVLIANLFYFGIIRDFKS